MAYQGNEKLFEKSETASQQGGEREAKSEAGIPVYHTWHLGNGGNGGKE